MASSSMGSARGKDIRMLCIYLEVVSYALIPYMAGPPKKRQKRDESKQEEGQMPQKKFYRQRAHANPFSDHDLT